MAVDRITRYAQAVQAGKVPAGTLHRLACERHLRDLESRASSGLVWRPANVDKVLTVAGCCVHLEGPIAGQPIRLEPWQVFIVGSMLGWLRPDGLRRYRTVYAEMPRGQGKSILAAIVALYLTFFDGEEGARGYCFATKRDQAKIVFDYARRMVLRSAALRRHINSQQLYNLTSEATDSKLEPLGADADTLDGLRPHVGIGDEIHKQPSASLVDVIQTGMGTRVQPVLFEITTAGDLSLRESVWWAHRHYSCQLLEGVLQDPTWFAFIAAADREDDWTLEATWRKANPNYGISVQPDDLARKCAQAVAMPSYQNTFRRLHLGQLVEQEDRYITMAQWDDPRAATPVDLSILAGRRCYAGLDLSTKIDLSALVLCFPDEDGGYTVLPQFWCPADQIADRSRADRVPYQRWAQEGVLEPTPGSVVDYSYIHQAIRELRRRYQIEAIAFDPWNSSHLVSLLQSEGAPMVEFGQGYRSMNPPTQELARLLASGSLRHGGHPVLRWNASNMTVAMDPAGNVKPDKARASERIDGMVALVMALGLASAAVETGADLLIRVV